MPRRIHVYTGRESNELANKIARTLNIERGKANIKEFADFEPFFRIKDIEQVGEDDIVVVVNATACPALKSYFDLWGILAPLKKRNPKRLIAVMPFMGFRRQERDSSGGEAIMTELMAKFIAAAGATDVILCDIHHLHILEDFEAAGVKPYHIDPDPLFVDILRGRHLTNWKVVRPDKGSDARATKLATALNLPMVKVEKYHPDHEVTQVKCVDGDFKGCHLLFRDDEIATAGTLMATADDAEAHGALDMTIMCTHGVLSANAVHKIDDRAFIQSVYITDSIYQPWEKRIPNKIKVLSLQAMIANTILNISEEPDEETK
ncbi:MAG: ribose-phosphate diphosphokinase [Patescibacteria group bacterium]